MPSTLWKSLVLLGSCLTLMLLPGCGGSGGEEEGTPQFPALTNDADPTPGPTNVVHPFFGAPFAGEFPVLNYFDHNSPAAFRDTNGFQLTWRGARAVVGVDVFGVDGHEGVDWTMPEGTPIFAVADGEVIFAGPEAPFFCPIEGRITSGLTVGITHIAPDGEVYRSFSLHLSRIDVEVGQRVGEGEQIALSGATGCVGRETHLHLQIMRVTNTNSGAPTPVDPYGWEGPGEDPWALAPEGAESIWLWKDGQAPGLVRR